MEDRTNQPFTEALGTMLRERSGDRMGRFPLAPFIAQIGDKTGLNYEYIRLMLRDQRTLRTDVIEAAAEALCSSEPLWSCWLVQVCSSTELTSRSDGGDIGTRERR
jgi:hypothetical protein